MPVRCARMAKPRAAPDGLATSILRRLAERGCAQAQLAYGRTLVAGPYGTRHPAHGWTWIEKATRMLPEAQEEAAQRLREGPHALPGPLERRARRWELAARLSGDVDAERERIERFYDR